MISSWPVYREDWSDPAAEQIIEKVKDIVKGVRNIRSEMNVAPSKKIHVIIVPEKEEDGSQLDVLKEMYQKLMNAGQVTVQADKDGIGEDAISLVVPGAVAYLPLDELVDKESQPVSGAVLTAGASCEHYLNFPPRPLQKPGGGGIMIQ